MADTKFSDFAAATQVANADIVVGVQGGANFQATKSMLLHGAAGEFVALVADGGQTASLACDSAQASVEVQDAGVVTVSHSSSFIVLNLLTNQTLFMSDNVGVLLDLGTGPAIFHIDFGGSTLFSIDLTGTDTMRWDGTQCFIRWVAGTSGNWLTTPPDDLGEAINRLAAAVAGLLGGPVP